MIMLTLPMPPTINTAYGHTQGRTYIKHAGRAYRKTVAEIVAAAGHATLTGRVSLFVAVHPATRAKQDLDNRSKTLQDALTHAGVWLDDEQIDELHLVRREVVRGGQVRIVITELKEIA